MQVNATGQSATATTKPSGLMDAGLGKDAFLKILIAQMRNQDPLNPSDGTAMVAQLAQFSTLEQLQNLNTKLDSLVNLQLLGELSGLVGKSVTYLDENGVAQGGKVDSVLWLGQHSVLKINEAAIPLNRIVEIREGV
ncbi:MAG: figD [Bacillota bacterium]|nr:MAG: figD [Bacillota bacterium]MBS3951263.1 flagellar biosynthesis protein FlgD [Peptococcaceae bacterium]